MPDNYIFMKSQQGIWLKLTIISMSLTDMSNPLNIEISDVFGTNY